MKKLLAWMLLAAASTVMAQSPAPEVPATALPAQPPASATQKIAQSTAPAPHGWRCLDNVTDKGGLKARQLLEQMVEAMGGEAWLQYSSLSQTGRSYSFYQGRPSNSGTLFWRFVKLPDKDRTEMTKQRDVVYIINGAKGYELTYKGTAAMDAKDLQESLRRRGRSLETVLRGWLADPATTVLYLGSGLADKRLAEMVSIINSKNEDLTLYIDPASHRLMQKSYHYRSEDGYKDEEIELYGNYHLVQGMQTPMTITRYHNGEIVSQRFVNATSYNDVQDEKIFAATITYDPYHYREKNNK
jgi:hypothetical protein